MTQLNPHKDTYAIPVPLDARFDLLPKDWYVCNANKEKPFLCASLSGYDGTPTKLIDLPLGNWQILGEVTKDNISFDVAPILNSISRVEGSIKMYRNYKEENLSTAVFTVMSKEESFYSLLAANGVYFENPLQKEKEAYLFKGSENTWSLEDLERWQSFEDKLVEKALIIQKVEK